MKRKGSVQTKMKGSIQIIIGKNKIGLLNIAKGQMLELTPDQARFFGLEEEAILAERIKNEI